MKKPDCLTYEEQDLPIHGWARDNSSQNWEECWLYRFLERDRYPFRTVNDSGGSHNIHFTTTDPNLKSVRELINELPAYIATRAMKYMCPDKLDDRVDWSSSQTSHPINHIEYFMTRWGETDEGTVFWIQVVNAVHGECEFPQEPVKIVDYGLDTLPAIPFEVRSKKSGIRRSVLSATEEKVQVSWLDMMTYAELRKNFTHADGSELGVEV